MEFETEDAKKNNTSIVLSGYGGYDKLRLEMRPKEEPKSGQLRLRLHACALNFADLYTRQGLFQGPKQPIPPFVMGREAAGTVDKVGSNVTTFEVGDRVSCFSSNMGLWAEYACVDEKDCLILPDSMSFEDGAAFYVNYLTAYFAIFEFGNLRPRQKIFVRSAAGGVGWAATQLAKTVADTIVIGTASNWKESAIKSNGVDFVYDTSETNYVDKVLEKFPEGINIVLDNQSGAEFGAAQRLLGQMGKIVHLGANCAIEGERSSIFRLLKLWWNLKPVSVTDLVMKNRAVCGFNLDVLKENSRVKFSEAVDFVTQLYVQQKIKPKIDSIWTFEQVGKATAHLATRKNIGKIILKTNLNSNEL